MYDSELEARITCLRVAYMATLIEEAVTALATANGIDTEEMQVQPAINALLAQTTEEYRLRMYEDAAVVYALLRASGGDMDAETLSSCTSAVISLTNAALRDNEKLMK